MEGNFENSTNNRKSSIVAKNQYDGLLFRSPVLIIDSNKKKIKQYL